MPVHLRQFDTPKTKESLIAMVETYSNQFAPYAIPFEQMAEMDIDQKELVDRGWKRHPVMQWMIPPGIKHLFV